MVDVTLKSRDCGVEENCEIVKMTKNDKETYWIVAGVVCFGILLAVAPDIIRWLNS